MSAKDGSFNQVTEGVTAHLNGLAAGRYTVCVRGADSAGNTGAADCFALTVSNLAATQTAAIASVTVSPTETTSTDQPTATSVTGGSATPTPTSVGLVGGSGFPSIPVIIGAIAALIIVGSLIFLILVRRRRDDEEDNDYPQRGQWRQ